MENDWLPDDLADSTLIRNMRYGDPTNHFDLHSDLVLPNALYKQWNGKLK